VFLGIVRDEPPDSRLLERQLRGEALHLAWVVDPHLRLARQRERGPDAAVLQGPFAVAVVRDLDLDHLLDRIRRSAGLLDALGDGRQQRLRVELHPLARGADEAVGDATGEAGRGRTGSGNPHLYRPARLVVDHRLVGLEELAVKGDELFGPELLDQLRRLLEPGEALLLIGPLDAERHLVEGLARAQPEDDAPAVDERPEGREGLGHDRRVVAERRRQHARPDRHLLRPHREGAEPDQAIGGMPVGVAPRLEVVADEDAVEAGAFGVDREREQVARAELFGRRLVSEGQHRAGQASEGRM
jgi:hypothetical protein